MVKNKSIKFTVAGASLFLFFIATVVVAQDAPESDPFSDEAQTALAAEMAAKEATAFLKPGQVSELTRKVNMSLVTLIQIGRDGDDRGTGAGFVVSEDGLIATNLHVIGEGRDVKVEFQNGETRNVTGVHAWDRHHDLAIVKIDPKGLNLKAIKLGDSSTVTQGQIIVGFGAPRGLKFSVVPGVVSAVRELEEGFLGDGEEEIDYPMIQIAMPIEQGNSGGPILNLNGEVVGIVTLKHTQTPNLGFAVQSDDLKPLLKTPNPTPIENWKTIGALDPRDWLPAMGANWTQSGGVIQVRGLGSGFGGRSVCVSEAEVPKEKYELAVRVKLNDESGAAGLIFSSDGGDNHYGFYPTNGQMRLTRFEGPSVNNWTILTTFDTDAYRPGEWNRLRVAVDKGKITGFVNGEEVMTIDDSESGLNAAGKVGLCKFRKTEADFRNFKVGPDLAIAPLDEKLVSKLGSAIDAFTTEQRRRNDDLISDLGEDAEASRFLLEKKALELEAKAVELRKLKRDLHTARVAKSLGEVIEKPEIDLFEAGLQIAWVANPDLDLDNYRARFNRLAEDARAFVGDVKEPAKQVEALRYFLFEESGFHGSRTEYYHSANSYLDHVLDDREGLPVTLSVVFIELARRLDIEGVSGLALPGHFVVGHFQGEDNLHIIDVFERGKVLNKAEAKDMIRSISGYRIGDDDFVPAEPRGIVVRMLRNLIGLEIDGKKEPTEAVKFLDLAIAIDPEAAQERFQRSLMRVQEHDRAGAEEDLDWLLENRPPGIDYRRLQMFRDQLDEIIGAQKK